LDADDWVFTYMPYSATKVLTDFGQLGWTNAPTNEYLPLHTGNLPAPAIKDPSKYFQSKLFTGNGTAIGSGGNAITLGGNTAMTPDLVWIKDRDTVSSHVVTDITRGVTNELTIEDNAVEVAVAEGLTSFNSDGFTVGNNSAYNTSSSPNIAWCWNTQGGAGASNTDGSINTTTTSVGTTQGMSISTYTGTGSAATIGHGLGVAPAFVMVKERANDVGGWFIYHKDMSADPETDYMYMDTTAAKVDDATVWNDTAPTTSVFSIGTHDDINASGDTYVAYCWAEVPGFSKFGDLKGNGSGTDGTFVYLGFRPAFLLFMTPTTTHNKQSFNSVSAGYNADNNHFTVDTTGIEITTNVIDLTSNGFKLRTTLDPNKAELGIYMAFAETPFGGEGVSQARAR